MMQNRSLKRYNLVLPEELFKEVENIAEKQQTTVVEVLRKFIKLGLLAVKLGETSDGGLFIREGDTEKQLLII